MERFIRKFVEEERIAFVNEVLQSGSNILIAKKYDINPCLLSKWVTNYRRYGMTLAPKEPVKKEIIPNYKKEYNKLKKELEEKDLEIKILRDLIKKKEPVLADKIAIANKWIAFGYSKAVVLRILGIRRSTYYAFMKTKEKRSYSNVGRKIPGYSFTFDGVKVNDIQIQKYITEIKNKEISKHYGYRKLTYELRREYSLQINKKKVRRLMKSLGFLGPNKRSKVTRISPKCKERKVTASNQLWQMDIKYAFIAGTRETAYITSIIDVYDREIAAYSVDLSCTGEVAKKVLIEALYSRDIKDLNSGLVVRTDNGSQFVSGTFEKACLTEKVFHERIPVRSPNYNAYIESYHRYLQDECLTGKIYMSLNHIVYDLDRYVTGYNYQRIHSAIGYVPPHEFYLAKLC